MLLKIPGIDGNFFFLYNNNICSNQSNSVPLEEEMDDTRTHRPATYRRQQQIEECLYESLLQRHYTSVSISYLCQQLGISRKSFYNYYPDKDSCFRSIINHKLQQCILCLTNAPRDNAVETFLLYWKNEKLFLDIIVRNNLLHLLMEQCMIFLKEESQGVPEFLRTPHWQTDEYILASYVNIHITLILQWYQHSFDTPLEEMVFTYQRLLYQPLMSKE